MGASVKDKVMGMSCHRCRTALTGYLHNELTPRARRAVDQHLNRCTACASVYVQQRRIAREFETGFTRIGQPGQARLSHLWTAIQAEINPARPTTQPTFSRTVIQPITVRYAFVVCVLMLVLVVPPLISHVPTVLALPDPPTPPQTLIAARLLTADETAACACDVVMAAETAEPIRVDVFAAREVVQQSISSQSNYAPTPGATDSP